MRPVVAWPTDAPFAAALDAIVPDRVTRHRIPGAATWGALRLAESGLLDLDRPLTPARPGDSVVGFHGFAEIPSPRTGSPGPNR